MTHIITYYSHITPLFFVKNIDMIYKMSHLNDLNIDTLKTGFHKITCLCADLFEKKQSSEEELIKLKNTYNELIKMHNQHIYLFCLDSFYFKYRVLHKEMEGISELVVFIHNRMYGEYYKLYNIMTAQLKEHHIYLPTIIEYKKYPVYKDLELLKEYSIENIKEIYSSIFAIISELYDYYNSKQAIIQEYVKQNNKTISSFIHTLEYENVLRRELLLLYISYVEFFHSTQTKYLEKLIYRMYIFQQDISEDMASSKNPPFIDNTKKMASIETAHPISVCIPSTANVSITPPVDIVVEPLVDTNENISITGIIPSELPELYEMFDANELAINELGNELVNNLGNNGSE